MSRRPRRNRQRYTYKEHALLVFVAIATIIGSSSIWETTGSAAIDLPAEEVTEVHEMSNFLDKVTTTMKSLFFKLPIRWPESLGRQTEQEKKIVVAPKKKIAAPPKPKTAPLIALPTSAPRAAAPVRQPAAQTIPVPPERPPYTPQWTDANPVQTIAPGNIDAIERERKAAKAKADARAQAKELRKQQEIDIANNYRSRNIYNADDPALQSRSSNPPPINRNQSTPPPPPPPVSSSENSLSSSPGGRSYSGCELLGFPPDFCAVICGSPDPPPFCV